jgi:hypothetical protein
MPRVPPERVPDLLAAIRAGKTVQIIATETGTPESTIRYLAAKHGLTITSRYTRTIPGGYWHRLRGDYWRASALRPAPRAQKPTRLTVAVYTLKDW